MEAVIYPKIKGKYKHYKGGLYKVLHMANDSEGKSIVVFKSLLFGGVRVKTLDEWNEVYNGKPKYKLIK